MGKKSEELWKESKKRIPGGVNSPVRAFQAVGGTPIFIEKAKGAYIYDVDGKEYVDFVGSWGPAILGHAKKDVIDVVKKACEDGLTFGAPTEKEAILARKITDCIPSMEMVRLVNSGTEAVMSAIRVARGYTKRDKIIKFRGCYHGHSDGLLVKAGSGALTSGVPDSAGIPASFTEHTLLAEYNGLSSVESLMNQYKNQIAAVIVEPVAANMGVVLPKKGFLEGLRAITREAGSLLIFDEVITGFRLGLGGAQEYYGVKPDLTILGKIVGGGMPIGAYGGRKEIMEVVAPKGEVYQAGTLAGNPIATAAGIATIDYIRKKPYFYQELNNKATDFANRIRECLGNKVWVNQVGALLSIFFTTEEVYDYRTATTSNTKEYAKYFHYMLERGIYLAPSQFESMFLSEAHTNKEIEKFMNALQSYVMTE